MNFDKLLTKPLAMRKRKGLRSTKLGAELLDIVNKGKEIFNKANTDPSDVD